MSITLDKPVPESGYTPCACRDCMDVAVSSDVSKPALCLPCKGEGCYKWPPLWNGAPLRGPRDSYGYECRRADAYGEC